MDAAATLVWLAPEPPDAHRASALSGWASHRGVRLVDPRDDRPPAIAIDESVADEVEANLTRAREAVAAHDGAAVDRALDAAESRLRAHAELPQAAWLMAEVERARSTRWLRFAPMDPAAASRAWSRAEVLDGGRLPSLGELGAEAQPRSKDAALQTRVPAEPGAEVTLGLQAGQRAWVDGRTMEGPTLETHAGLHALVVTWDGAPVWARWIELLPGSYALPVDAPTAPPCSLDDVQGAKVDAGGIVPAGVRCPQWVAATAGPDGSSVRLAVCRGDHCGPLLTWGEAALAWTWKPATGAERTGWPAWATWSLVGAGAAIAAGVTIAATQALATPPSETRFVSGGLKMP